MVEKDIKKKTIFGMVWTTIERFGSMAMAFISNLVLARLLLPSDFGVIGMLHIFIAISGAFMMGGFSGAIIQKKHVTQNDYSTAFIWNMILSLLLYILLFFSAPAISRFYNMPELSSVLRVYGIVLVLVALGLVQNSILKRELRFKQLTYRNLIASFSGLVIGVLFAFLGFRYWSLVASALMNQLMNVVLVWKISDWRPSLIFDKQSFKALFGFGSMLMLTSLVDKVYGNIQGLLIGKWYTAEDLGYYTQAKKLEDIPTATLSNIVGTVSFPVFSKFQDDKQKLLDGFRKNIVAITYYNFPLCILLLIVAKPLIELLYGSKWDASVPYFQLLCVSGMLYTMTTLNSLVIKSLGRGKLYFSIHLIQRVLGLVFMFVGIGYGVKGLLIAVVISSFLNYIIYSIVNSKLLKYGLWSQCKDVISSLLLSVIIGVIVFILGYYSQWNSFLVMGLQILLYGLLYYFVSKAMGLEGYQHSKTVFDILLQNRR